MKEKTDKGVQILDAAEKAFAENGFKETSTRLIAQLAGVNSSMLNYYFQSKEKLLEAVLERRIDGFDREWEELAPRAAKAIDKLRALIRLSSRLMSTNISFFRFILREQLISSGSETAYIIRNYFKQRLNSIRDILESGVEKKEFLPVDIDFVTLSITGTYISCLLNPEFLADHSNQDTTTNRLAIYLEH